MAEKTATSYSTDPALYIYTSLTAGSSHIVTATSRLETILRANRVPFKALDIATDEKARMLWGRRAGKDQDGRARKLPGLVQMGLVLGDLVEIEEWNEYGELKQHVTIYYDDFTMPPKSQAPSPIGMRPLNQPFPRTGIAASVASAVASAAAAAAAAAASTPKTTTTKTTTTPAPPAPPLPTDKDKTKIPLSSPASTSTAKKPATATAPAPANSIAEEAAQKAKKAQLERLREKVHGKKDGAPSSGTAESKGKENAKPVAASSPTASKKDTPAASSITKGVGNLKIGGAGSATGLQSPTTGKWRSGSSSAGAGGAQTLLQSPTTGTWKADGSRGLDATVTEHRGSVVASASAAEIAAIEKAEAIPEVDSSEEEDSEDEDEDEEDDEDEDDDDDEDDEDDDEEEDEEDEDDDDDDEEDDDDDEDDSDEDEESEDDTKKAKPKN
ncbi:hypothetical protein GGS24DRAFT_59933 [Hypoxylon argillaceum]|nr:hypothetical protein GGS24DRAFT_59933 [Hypoxylon argillaceum]